MGPCIVTADEIPDPQTLDLWLAVNGVEKQRSNTSHMLFKVDELIADISQGITLEPGDIIATGTPAGVGAGRDPQERSEEHTSELQSLMRISYAVFCLKKKKHNKKRENKHMYI